LQFCASQGLFVPQIADKLCVLSATRRKIKKIVQKKEPNATALLIFITTMPNFLFFATKFARNTKT
jgi:hypothetical protein